jgi:hypothetical protein
MLIPYFRLVPLALALASSASFAQSPPAQASPPGMTAEPLPYPSALETYKPFSDETLIPWKEANDEVGRIGGWREYARESRQDPSRSSSPAPAQESGQRGGHGQH